MRVNLTDRYIRSLKKPTTGLPAVVIADEGRAGLYLRVGSRKMAWMFEKQVFGGKKRKHTLGSWPSVTLSQARESARQIEAEAEQGIDRIEVNQQNRLARAREESLKITTAKVIKRYADLKLNNLATGTAVERDLNLALADHLEKPLCDLIRTDLQSAIDAHMDAGHKVAANRTRAHLRAFTRWAQGREYLGTDIGHALQGAGREEPRDRVLSLDEVKAIYLATFNINSLWGVQFRLLLLTGQRRSEIGDVRWSNIDMRAATITLTGAQTKNRRPHITHLSAPALAEIMALSDARVNSDILRESSYLFTTTGKTPASGVSGGKRSLDRVLGLDPQSSGGFGSTESAVEPFRLHDFRRAMATALAGEGVAEGVVDRIQNHAASGSAPSAVARTYQQHDLLPDRARALNLWGGLVTGKILPRVEREGADVLAFEAQR